MTLLAALLALFVGLNLGLLGGGGSILMLPILVYVVGLSPAQAVPLALLVVLTTSLSAFLQHARAGHARVRTGLLFGGAGMTGAALGGVLAPHLPTHALMGGFAILMIATGTVMLRGKSPALAERPPNGTARSLVQGAGIGVVSGLTGAGGGFLVVPSLAMFEKLPMREAIGTSLLVIALQSAAALAAHSFFYAPDFSFALPVVAAALVGSVVGSRYSAEVPQDKLRRWFAALIVVLGVVMGALQGVELLRALAASAWAPLAGGLLIGVASSLLWLTHGRIAGISGIVGGLTSAERGDRAWRVAFVAGLLGGGALMWLAVPGAFGRPRISLVAIAAAGLLVGVGTTLANGCTSGHGVCGISRLSKRSLIATSTFMVTAALTVFVTRHLVGGL